MARPTWPAHLAHSRESVAPLEIGCFRPSVFTGDPPHNLADLHTTEHRAAHNQALMPGCVPPFGGTWPPWAEVQTDVLKANIWTTAHV